MTELRSIAQRIADGLPPTVEEVVVTGSVSRGVADEVSDVELLIVTRDNLELGERFSLAEACGLTDIGTCRAHPGRVRARGPADDPPPTQCFVIP